MREINAQLITDKVAELCIDANCSLPCDIRKRIEDARANEPWATAQGILDKIIENYNIADENRAPICQDTGVACVFLKIGQDVHINGDLTEAVNEGVRRGYRDGYLRKSVVKDPLRRVNTGDNTPAMLYIELVPGDKIELTVAPKGFGSENMSRIAMLKPSDGIEGVKNFILKTAEEAGPNPCPPIVIGVGIGGTFDKAALLAKKHLCAAPTSAMRMSFMRSWKMKCSERSMLSASGRRASAENHCACGQYRGYAHAYCRLARCGEHQLPCYKA